jgi:DNA-binding response OmpR family regulator
VRYLLIVEDNDDDYDLMVRELHKSQLKNDLVRLKDGGELLNFFWGKDSLKNSILPEAILLDLRLPLLDGRKFLTRLRADPNLKDTPVVVVSGSDDTDDYVESFKLGCPFIRKPVTFETLVDGAGKIGLGWLLVR